MNTNTESKHTMEHDAGRSPKLIANGTASTLVMAIVAVGLFLTVPSAKAETKLSMTDNDFILAAAQGGLTKVKLGELAAQKGTREDVKEFGKMDAKEFKAESAETKDVDIKSFLDKSIPVVGEHLKRITAMKQ